MGLQGVICTLTDARPLLTLIQFETVFNTAAAGADLPAQGSKRRRLHSNKLTCFWTPPYGITEISGTGWHLRLLIGRLIKY
jgi:hypothetical protein